MSDATASRMVWKAISLFRQYYGDYPTRIGLDIKTRFKEYVAARGQYLCINEPDPLHYLKMPSPFTVDTLDTLPPMLTMKRHEIAIDPLVKYDLVAYEASHLHIPHPEPDMIWCQWGDVTVKMSLWFTDTGYHCIIWDEEEEEEKSLHIL